MKYLISSSEASSSITLQYLSNVPVPATQNIEHFVPFGSSKIITQELNKFSLSSAQGIYFYTDTPGAESMQTVSNAFNAMLGKKITIQQQPDNVLYFAKLLAVEYTQLKSGKYATDGILYNKMLSINLLFGTDEETEN